MRAFRRFTGKLRADRDIGPKMPGAASNPRWILAVVTAVVLPAIILHGTCIAVMGPGTWGSGLQEVEPEFRQPTPTALQYGRAIEDNQAGPGGEGSSFEPEARPEMAGQIKWIHRSGERTAILTEDVPSSDQRQRLYVEERGRARQIPLPRDHLVVRPQWAGETLIYERWNPWAIPATRKLRRYVASWVDPSLRPEVALYESDSVQVDWRHLMPGHTLTVSPNGRFAAFLRSGALLAGYYSIHVWRVGDQQAVALLSLREHDGKGTQSFSLLWSRDSEALLIRGETDGFRRRGSRGGGGPEGIPMRLVYIAADHGLYDLNLGD